MATGTSSNDTIKAIRQARRKFAILDDNMSAASKHISESVAIRLQEELTENYHNFVSSLQNDVQDRQDTIIYTEDLGDGYRVGITGHQVIYDEFGTGTNGELNPHPDKNKYPLNDYNSGKTIKTDKRGFDYWVWHGHPTYGIPAGMFMYNSFMNVADEEANRIIAKEVRDTITKTMKG